MKMILSLAILFASLNCVAQQDSLQYYWTSLTKQFLYRAEVFMDFAGTAEKLKFSDTASIRGIREVNKRLGQTLEKQQPVDSATVACMASENKRLTGYMSKLLAEAANKGSLKSKDESGLLQASLIEAENRVFAREKAYNQYCTRMGKMDLVYTRAH